jgi:hypothetical protein
MDIKKAIEGLKVFKKSYDNEDDGITYQINLIEKDKVLQLLDLQELERKLDDALAKETPESLMAWLNAKRNEED